MLGSVLRLFPVGTCPPLALAKPRPKHPPAPEEEEDEFHNKNPPTPCLWQAPASTQKTKRKTRPAIRRSARWRVSSPAPRNQKENPRPAIRRSTQWRGGGRRGGGGGGRPGFTAGGGGACRGLAVKDGSNIRRPLFLQLLRKTFRGVYNPNPAVHTARLPNLPVPLGGRKPPKTGAGRCGTRIRVVNNAEGASKKWFLNAATVD